MSKKYVYVIESGINYLCNSHLNSVYEFKKDFIKQMKVDKYKYNRKEDIWVKDDVYRQCIKIELK